MSKENILDLDDDFLNELRQDFLEEARELLELASESFLGLEKNPNDAEIMQKIFRVFHNIKGSSKAVGFAALSEFSHHAEDLLVKVRDGKVPANQSVINLLLECSDGLSKGLACVMSDPKLEFLELTLSKLRSIESVEEEAEAEEPTSERAVFEESTSKMDHGSAVERSISMEAVTKKRSASEDVSEMDLQVEMARQEDQKQASALESIKLPTWKINNLLDYFGEQVILQSKIGHLIRSDIYKNQEEILSALVQLDKITSDLQQTAITLRMVSLKPIFGRMERAVRDVALQSGKKVTFAKVGQDSELDKTIVESLIDPLTHMVRNAVDHGLETPEERRAQGKDETGTVMLKAYRQGGSFYIEVRDDGRGLDRSKILKKGVEKGLINANQNYSDNEIYNLIFQSGFSTKDQVSDISGRGVGMDVVRDMFKRLKGTCEIESTPGKGSRFIVRLPLTLALFNGTLIGVSNQKFIVPNSDYSETVSVDCNAIQDANRGEKVVRIKDRVMSVVPLSAALLGNGSDRSKTQRKSFIAAITRVDARDYAILFDELYSQEKVVLKKLGPEASRVTGISGGTILGDGNVALVLELKEIVKEFREAS